MAQNPQNFTAQVRESDIEDTVMSTTGSKGLQEAFCKHEDLLLSKAFVLILIAILKVINKNCLICISSSIAA